jgi:hypothetical protein
MAEGLLLLTISVPSVASMVAVLPVWKVSVLLMVTLLKSPTSPPVLPMSKKGNELTPAPLLRAMICAAVPKRESPRLFAVNTAEAPSSQSPPTLMSPPI